MYSRPERNTVGYLASSELVARGLGAEAAKPVTAGDTCNAHYDKTERNYMVELSELH